MCGGLRFDLWAFQIDVDPFCPFDMKFVETRNYAKQAVDIRSPLALTCHHSDDSVLHNFGNLKTQPERNSIKPYSEKHP